MKTYRMKVDVVLLEDYEALCDKLATALREKQAYQEQGVRAVQRANELEDALAAQRRVADDALTELHDYMSRVSDLEDRLDEAEGRIGVLSAHNEELEEAVRRQADVIAKLQIESHYDTSNSGHLS